MIKKIVRYEKYILNDVSCFVNIYGMIYMKIDFKVMIKFEKNYSIKVALIMYTCI